MAACIFDPTCMLASLDHAIWFHRLSGPMTGCSTPKTAQSRGAGRAFCRGTLFTRSGELVASTTQEGLVRERRAD